MKEDFIYYLMSFFIGFAAGAAICYALLKKPKLVRSKKIPGRESINAMLKVVKSNLGNSVRNSVKKGPPSGKIK